MLKNVKNAKKILPCREKVVILQCKDKGNNKQFKTHQNEEV